MNHPRILLIDIETAPSLGYYFDLWKEGNIVGNVKSWYILSFAWQWAGEKKIDCRGIVDYPRYKKNKEDDFALVHDIHTLLSQADIVVAHNGDRFDIRKINARFLKHGFPPPAPYKTVDTLKVARKYFAMDSNRLNDVAQYLGVGSKLPHTGFKLWEDCMRGDKKAWDLMKRYNKQDVVLLHDVYMTLRTWMTNHPNVNIFTGKNPACPNCGGAVQKRGFNITKTGRTQRYQCERGCWSQATKSEKVVDIK